MLVYAEGLVDDGLPGIGGPDQVHTCTGFCHAAPAMRQCLGAVVALRSFVGWRCGIFRAPLLAHAVGGFPRGVISATLEDCNRGRSAFSDEADTMQRQEEENDRAESQARVRARDSLMRAKAVIDHIAPDW